MIVKLWLEDLHWWILKNVTFFKCSKGFFLVEFYFQYNHKKKDLGSREEHGCLLLHGSQNWSLNYGVNQIVDLGLTIEYVFLFSII